MKPRWLRAMIATPSPALDALARRAPRASAFERRWSSAKVSAPASSISIVSSGWVIAAPAIPAAGEAPQRRSSRSDAGELVGADRPDHAGLGAASCRLNGTSGSGPSEPSLTAARRARVESVEIHRPKPMCGGAQASIEGDRDAGDALAAADRSPCPRWWSP